MARNQAVSKKKTAAKKTAAKKSPAKKKRPAPIRATPGRAPQKKKKSPAAKKKVRFVNWLFASVSAAAIFMIFLYIIFIRPVARQPIEYRIRPGASVSGVARDLDLGIEFALVVRIHGNKVMAGTYDLPAGASVWKIARMTARGEIASVSITVPEGLTVKQIVNLLNKNQSLTGTIGSGKSASCRDGISYGVEGTDETSWACYDEGGLFPDTYIVPKGAGRIEVLDVMRKKMDRLRDNIKKVSVFPYPLKNWNEVMTLASIVQKETAKESEMPLVASVYINRLRKKMRLQADPTVVYAITGGLGDMREQRLYAKHLRVKSPYNTYLNAGLPPAPIANVGMAALTAVLKPADTNYYYFVADGVGGHTFSRTLDEHNVNRDIWRKIKNAK